MAKKNGVKKSSASKQRMAAQKRVRTMVTRVAVIVLLLAFLVFMTVVLFSTPKMM